MTSSFSPATIGVSCDYAHRVMLQGTTIQELRNDVVGGDNCPTLLVEYRPSSRHLQRFPWSEWTSLL